MPTAVEHDTLERAKQSIPALPIASRTGKDLDQEPNVPDNLPSPDDDVPDNFDNLMFLSPEQYEVLLKAREEQQGDLSREQVEALLAALEERA